MTALAATIGPTGGRSATAGRGQAVPVTEARWKNRWGSCGVCGGVMTVEQRWKSLWAGQAGPPPTVALELVMATSAWHPCTLTR
jgi:hypothetical protein